MIIRVSINLHAGLMKALRLTEFFTTLLICEDNIMFFLLILSANFEIL